MSQSVDRDDRLKSLSGIYDGRIDGMSVVGGELRKTFDTVLHIPHFLAILKPCRSSRRASSTTPCA
eukprot:362057-Chlamydomonas_euryale.AAC.2